MSPLNLFLILGGPWLAVGGPWLITRWMVRQHAEQYAEDVCRIHGERPKVAAR